MVGWPGCRAMSVCQFFFSSRRRHTRSKRDWSQTCALPILIQLNERLVLDVEGSDAESFAWMSPSWITQFFACLPSDRRPILYTSDRVWRLLGEPAFPGAVDVDLWLPRYSAGGLLEPVVPKPWRDAARAWTLWQHSEAATVPGVQG